ncbi:hypothetical protein BaRGS_00014285, partial [Batillaria attramentaria]
IVSVFVTAVAASVIPNPAEDTVNDRETRAAGCMVDGSMRTDGANFTRPATGPCVVYTCSNGEVLPASYGCVQRDGRSCVKVGETFKDGCFTYACEKEQQSEFSVSYHTRQVDWGCEYNGQCVPENHTISQACATVQCQKRGLAVGFFPVAEGCQIDSDCVDVGQSGGCQIGSDCVDVGQSVVVQCRTLTCQKENLNGITLLDVRPTKIQCVDADGQCHDSDELFDMHIDGELHHNCSCVMQDVFAVGYSCPVVIVTVEESINEAADAPGQGLKNECTDADNECHDSGEYFDMSIGGVRQCLDADDACHDSGELFDMFVNRKRQHNCTCTVHGLSSVQYACPSPSP